LDVARHLRTRLRGRRAVLPVDVFGLEDRHRCTSLNLLPWSKACAKDFVVIHAHIDWLPLPLLSRLDVPFGTTMHGRLDLPGLSEVLRQFPGAGFVSISDHQRLPLPEANWTATIQHGLPSNNFRPSFDQGSYLAFLGRLAAEKAPRTPSASRAPPECPCASPPRFRAPRPSTSRSYLSPTSTAGRSSSSATVPRRGSGPAVSDRLAGALRPRHDRGDGLWDASDRLPLRLRARVRRGQHDRLHRRERGAGCQGPWAIWAGSTDEKYAPASRNASPRSNGERVRKRVTRFLIAALSAAA
jgi:hypothetical protein